MMSSLHAIHQRGWRSPLIYFTVKSLLIIPLFFHRHSAVENIGKKRWSDAEAWRRLTSTRMNSDLFQWMSCSCALKRKNAPTMQLYSFIRRRDQTVSKGIRLKSYSSRKKIWKGRITKVKSLHPKYIKENFKKPESKCSGRGVMNMKFNSDCWRNSRKHKNWIRVRNSANNENVWWHLRSEEDSARSQRVTISPRWLASEEVRNEPRV